MSIVDLKVLRQMVKDRIDREQTSDILSLSGYEVGRDWKFALREEEKTPSASIRQDGYINDFGGDFGGDIVALLHEERGMSLRDATLYVCDQMGIFTDESHTHVPIPIKGKPQLPTELTDERCSEITAEIMVFDQSSELQTFKNPDYAKEALVVAPMWVWNQAKREDITLFKELTTFDSMNNTLVIKVHDYTGKLISYKRRRFRDHKWSSAKGTHPNKQCMVSIPSSSESVYIAEGHHDLLTAILLGLNVLMIPTVGYKVFNAHELALLKGRDVVFLPDLKRGDTKGRDVMKLLAEQANESAKSVNVVNVKKVLDLMEIDYTVDSIDLSDAVYAWDGDRDGFKSTLLYVGDLGAMFEKEIF